MKLEFKLVEFSTKNLRPLWEKFGKLGLTRKPDKFALRKDKLEITLVEQEALSLCEKIVDSIGVYNYQNLSTYISQVNVII